MQLVLLPSFWFYHSFKSVLPRKTAFAVLYPDLEPWNSVGQDLQIRSPSEFSWLLGPGPKLPFLFPAGGSVPRGLSLQSTLLAGTCPRASPIYL